MRNTTSISLAAIVSSWCLAFTPQLQADALAQDNDSLAHFSQLQAQIARASAKLELKKIEAQIAKLQAQSNTSTATGAARVSTPQISTLSLVSLIGSGNNYSAVITRDNQNLTVHTGDVLGRWHISHIDSNGVVLVMPEGIAKEGKNVLEPKKFLLTLSGFTPLSGGRK